MHPLWLLKQNDLCMHKYYARKTIYTKLLVILSSLMLFLECRSYISCLYMHVLAAADD